MLITRTSHYLAALVLATCFGLLSAASATSPSNLARLRRGAQMRRFKSSHLPRSHLPHGSVSLAQVRTAKVSRSASQVAVSHPAVRKNMSEKERADSVRDALRHLWHGYKESWGSDEVRPFSGKPGGRWGDIGMCIIDTLDTMWLAGLKDEFAEGEQWVSDLHIEVAPKEGSQRSSFFEMTIRGLGGLLSAYNLSGKRVFLEKAKDLGDRLLQAFPQPGHKVKHIWPYAYINIRETNDVEKSAKWLQMQTLADAGSNTMEFEYLTHASGDPKYQTAADAGMKRILDLAGKEKKHLAPIFLREAKFAFQTEQLSVGAFADSYYEYLLKTYLLSGKRERVWLDEWKAAMHGMREALIRTTPNGRTYIATEAMSLPKGKFSTSSTQMEHLSCFMGGLLALGAHLLPREDAESWWLPTGAAITETCYEMYHQSPSGIAPERVAFSTNGDMILGGLNPVQRGNRVRPETLEALFYLYRVTGNTTYRDWSWNIFQAINRTMRTAHGFASARDVIRTSPVLDDSQETFVGAETLKYAMLIHLNSSVLPLEDFVLNTEAHPFPVFKPDTGKSSSLLRRESVDHAPADATQKDML
mmetsp:Transcript_129792/g.250330  ORF Transcript_129792/g.250330 Transcript_129792/m.250330 type:complete len:586 (+) Transcript_129792:70-1827(+)